MKTRERRSSTRKNVHMAVHYSHEDKVFTEFARNVSARGMNIECASPVQPGSKLTLIIQHRLHDNPFKVYGKVMWTDSKCMGIKLN